jgi:pimeloyl-ACP methyl ester carboxylesterase
METLTQRTFSIDGMRMEARTGGRGDPLLLLHGFTGAGADFHHLFDLEELGRDYSLVIPDLRGHGASLNPLATFTHRRCALDVLALLDEIGLDRVRAVGLSLGGNTLLHAATLAPERFGRMVLVSATSHFPDQARAIMRTMTEETRSPEDWAVLRATHLHGDEQIRALLRHARGFAESTDDMRFTPETLARIASPVLLVNGDRDPLYPIEILLSMYRAIPSASLFVLPGGGHLPVFAEPRRAFVETALVFLRSVT